MNYSFITFLAGDKHRTHADVVSNSHVVVLRVCSESRGRDVYRDVAGGCDVALIPYRFHYSVRNHYDSVPIL
jgi:hypothetical protein